jgi:hypothetical protein
MGTLTGDITFFRIDEYVLPQHNYIHIHSYNQRAGMGLLEHQAMPSLREVAHDGWLCKFTK